MENKSDSESNIQEVLLSEEENRYVLFPIQHDDIWKEYKKAMANFWTPEETANLANCIVALTFTAWY